jgi:hypothetical protein
MIHSIFIQIKLNDSTFILGYRGEPGVLIDFDISEE